MLKLYQAKNLKIGDPIYHSHCNTVATCDGPVVIVEKEDGKKHWRIPVNGARTTCCVNGIYYITGLMAYCWQLEKPSWLK